MKNEQLPPGWPKEIPFPTIKEAETAVQRVRQKIKESRAQTKRKIRHINKEKTAIVI